MQIMTANRLLDGEVVYLTAGDHWSEFYGDAQIAKSKEEAQTFAERARVAEARHEIVDAYLIKVGRAEDGSLALLSMKERIRSQGPTTRRDLGKQAKKS